MVVVVDSTCIIRFAAAAIAIFSLLFLRRFRMTITRHQKKKKKTPTFLSLSQGSLSLVTYPFQSQASPITKHPIQQPKKNSLSGRAAAQKIRRMSLSTFLATKRVRQRQVTTISQIPIPRNNQSGRRSWKKFCRRKKKPHHTLAISRTTIWFVCERLQSCEGAGASLVFDIFLIT